MELKYAKKGSCGAAEECEQGVLSAGHPYHSFQGKNPPLGGGGETADSNLKIELARAIIVENAPV